MLAMKSLKGEMFKSEGRAHAIIAKGDRNDLMMKSSSESCGVRSFAHREARVTAYLGSAGNVAFGDQANSAGYALQAWRAMPSSYRMLAHPPKAGLIARVASLCEATRVSLRVISPPHSFASIRHWCALPRVRHRPLAAEGSKARESTSTQINFIQIGLASSDQIHQWAEKSSFIDLCSLGAPGATLSSARLCETAAVTSSYRQRSFAGTARFQGVGVAGVEGIVRGALRANPHCTPTDGYVVSQGGFAMPSSAGMYRMARGQTSYTGGLPPEEDILTYYPPRPIGWSRFFVPQTWNSRESSLSYRKQTPRQERIKDRLELAGGLQYGPPSAGGHSPQSEPALMSTAGDALQAQRWPLAIRRQRRPRGQVTSEPLLASLQNGLDQTEGNRPPSAELYSTLPEYKKSLTGSFEASKDFIGWVDWLINPITSKAHIGHRPSRDSTKSWAKPTEPLGINLDFPERSEAMVESGPPYESLTSVAARSLCQAAIKPMDSGILSGDTSDESHDENGQSPLACSSSAGGPVSLFVAKVPKANTGEPVNQSSGRLWPRMAIGQHNRPLERSYDTGQSQTNQGSILGSPEGIARHAVGAGGEGKQSPVSPLRGRSLEPKLRALLDSDQVNAYFSGEVTRPDTLNYRSFKPEKNGLFCERIFGPVNDWTCACGQTKEQISAIETSGGFMASQAVSAAGYGCLPAFGGSVPLLSTDPLRPVSNASGRFEPSGGPPEAASLSLATNRNIGLSGQGASQVPLPLPLPPAFSGWAEPSTDEEPSTGPKPSIERMQYNPEAKSPVGPAADSDPANAGYPLESIAEGDQNHPIYNAGFRLILQNESKKKYQNVSKTMKWIPGFTSEVGQVTDVDEWPSPTQPVMNGPDQSSHPNTVTNEPRISLPVVKHRSASLVLGSEGMLGGVLEDGIHVEPALPAKEGLGFASQSEAIGIANSLCPPSAGSAGVQYGFGGRGEVWPKANSKDQGHPEVSMTSRTLEGHDHEKILQGKLRAQRCPICKVEITSSRFRRYRMGYISLACPVTHIWYLNSRPNIFSLLLKLPTKYIKRLTYYKTYTPSVLDFEYINSLLAPGGDYAENEWDFLHSWLAGKESSLDFLFPFPKSFINSPSALTPMTRVEPLPNSLQPAGSESTAGPNWMSGAFGGRIEPAADSDQRSQPAMLLTPSFPRVPMIQQSFKIPENPDWLRHTGAKALENLLKSKNWFSEVRKLQFEIDSLNSNVSDGHSNFPGSLGFTSFREGSEGMGTGSQPVNQDGLHSRIIETFAIKVLKRRKRRLRLLKILQTFQKSGFDFSRVIFSVLPVLPPDLRPIIQLGDGQLASSDVNDLYRRILSRNNRLKYYLYGALAKAEGGRSTQASFAAKGSEWQGWPKPFEDLRFTSGLNGPALLAEPAGGGQGGFGGPYQRSEGPSSVADPLTCEGDVTELRLRANSSSSVEQRSKLLNKFATVGVEWPQADRISEINLPSGSNYSDSTKSKSAVFGGRVFVGNIVANDEFAVPFAKRSLIIAARDSYFRTSPKLTKVVASRAESASGYGYRPPLTGGRSPVREQACPPKRALPINAGSESPESPVANANGRFEPSGRPPEAASSLVTTLPPGNLASRAESATGYAISNASGLLTPSGRRGFNQGLGWPRLSSPQSSLPRYCVTWAGRANRAWRAMPNPHCPPSAGSAGNAGNAGEPSLPSEYSTELENLTPPPGAPLDSDPANTAERSQQIEVQAIIAKGDHSPLSLSPILTPSNSWPRSEHFVDFLVRSEQQLVQLAVDALLENGKTTYVRHPAGISSPGRLYTSLSDRIGGKQGRFRMNLLGKRVDYSGRSVIVVGPYLEIFQCGLPYEMGLELFQPFIIRHMLEIGCCQTIRSAKNILRWNKVLGQNLLHRILQSHPILLNRAPTLHRLGIQAFQPVLVFGRGIHLHPLVCPSFNADFDGDQMAVHIPLSPQARAEARVLMLASGHWLSTSTGQANILPSQDIVLGFYFVSLEKYGYQKGKGLSFNNIDDVIQAYETGSLELHSQIWVSLNQLSGLRPVSELRRRAPLDSDHRSEPVEPLLKLLLKKVALTGDCLNKSSQTSRHLEIFKMKIRIQGETYSGYRAEPGSVLPKRSIHARLQRVRVAPGATVSNDQRPTGRTHFTQYQGSEDLPSELYSWPTALRYQRSQIVGLVPEGDQFFSKKEYKKYLRLRFKKEGTHPLEIRVNTNGITTKLYTSYHWQEKIDHPLLYTKRSPGYWANPQYGVSQSGWASSETQAKVRYLESAGGAQKGFAEPGYRPQSISNIFIRTTPGRILINQMIQKYSSAI